MPDGLVESQTFNLKKDRGKGAICYAFKALFSPNEEQVMTEWLNKRTLNLNAKLSVKVKRANKPETPWRVANSLHTRVGGCCNLFTKPCEVEVSLDKTDFVAG